MQIFIEGESYPIKVLEETFEDPRFYKLNGLEGTLTSVGYYHSFSKNTLAFMLPKVFMRDGEETVLDISKEELVDFLKNTSVKHKDEYIWVRQLMVYFYNSLLEYRKRYVNTSIGNRSETFELNTNIKLKDYSYLDILLSFVNFYKKNKAHILFKQIEFKSHQVRKPKWEKTVRKSQPILINGAIPVYLNLNDKKKTINKEEELITYYFSILNHFNKNHSLNLHLEKSYQLIEGKAFENLKATGLVRLKKIRYRYFSDVLRRMYGLCEMFFAQHDSSSIKRKREDFISITNYNLVFEDMIDKLFSSDFEKYEVNGININKLKNSDDGKIIDHIYDYQSLLDTSNIFYIGDSKYYKSNNIAAKVSKYKQFTYAKNVIQFNIDLLNVKGEKFTNPLRYRDQLTEGYNVSPNFFIYGYITDVLNYVDPLIEKKGNVVKSFHFEERLFDRDTLFVHQYKINFLFALKSYTTFNSNDIEIFRKNAKKSFRDNFLAYFSDPVLCGFKFYQAIMPETDYENFINKHFREINGKCFVTNDKRMLLANYQNDEKLEAIMVYFKSIELIIEPFIF